MVNCPACEANMDVDEDQLQEGGEVVCGDCGAHFEVVNPQPLELEQIVNEDDEDEDDEDEFDDEDDELDEDEEAGYDDEDDGFADSDEDDE